MKLNPPLAATPLRHLAIGLIVIVLLVFANLQLEDSRYGQWFNARGYEVLHSFIPQFDPEHDPAVVVLDISSLPVDKNGETSTAHLRTIIDALMECRAKAIAIDINFATGARPGDRIGSRADDDPEFFDYLHTLTHKGANIFVGIHEFGREPDTWLGHKDDQDLAADMTLLNGYLTEVPAWLQCDGDPKLRSISRALADSSGVQPHPPTWLKALLEDYEDSANLREVVLNDQNDNRVVCRQAMTLVNYAKLELVQKLILQTYDRESIVAAKDVEGVSRFRDKLVLIGKAQRNTEASFYVPGRNPVSGTFVHAMAANTLVADPVYKLKHWFAILLDVFLGVLVVVGLFVVRTRNKTIKDEASEVWENRFIWAAIVLVVCIGLVLVRFYNVLWLDFLLVIFALLLHSKVQHGIGHLFQVVFTRKRDIKKAAPGVKTIILILPVIAALALPVNAQKVAATVKTVKGKAMVKANHASDSEATVLKENAQLEAGQMVKCGKGCAKLEITYCNYHPKLIGINWVEIRNVPCFATRYGPIGGGNKGVAKNIASPIENEVVRPRLFFIKWRSKSRTGRSKLSIEVLYRKEQIWGPTSVSLDTGIYSSPILTAKLIDAQRAGKLNLLLTSDEGHDSEPDAVVFRLIALNDEEALIANLQDLAKEPDIILRTIARGLAFYQYELYDDAVSELERALAALQKRKRVNQREIIWVKEQTILANYQAQNDKRARDLCLHWIGPAEPPSVCTRLIDVDQR